MNWIDQLGISWHKELEGFINSSTFLSIGKQIASLRQQGNQIIPVKGSDTLFKAFRTTPYDKIKVVILGPEPHKGWLEYDGYAYSAPACINIPQETRLFLEEIESDVYDGLNLDRVNDGNLDNLVQQHVFLLNICLTCDTKSEYAHFDIWKPFIEEIIRVLNNKQDLIWIFGSTKSLDFYNNVNIKHFKIKGLRNAFSAANNQLLGLNKSEIIW